MYEKFILYKNKIVEKYLAIDKSLRTKIIVSIIFLIIALALTIFLTVRPKWVVFESNSDIQTIGKLQNAFNNAGIKNKIVQNGSSIQIQQKDTNQAKILIAESDITKSGFSFEDALNTSNIGLSESDKKEIFLRAYENDIAEQIKTIDKIEDAVVKLVLPAETNFFNDSKKEARAGVTLTLSGELNKQQTLTIARLVAMSVNGLEMKNIEIVDQNANSLYSGIDETGSSSLSNKEDVEKTKTQEIENKIRAALSQLYDDVNIIANIKIDWNTKQEKNIVYTTPIEDTTVGVPKSQTKENENVVNGGTSLSEPGFSSNAQTPTNYGTDSNQQDATYDSSRETNEYLYNQSEVFIDDQGGKIIPDQSSISVVVYNYKEYNESVLKNNKTINKEMSWEEFKSQNNKEIRIEIDPDLIETLKVGTGISNLTVVGYQKPIFVAAVKQKIDFGQIIILIILLALVALLAFGIIKKANPDEIEEIEPEISIEDLIVSNKREDEKVAEQLSEITEVESPYKLKINDFIEEKSETVAQLLRNWFDEEWEG